MRRCWLDCGLIQGGGVWLRLTAAGFARQVVFGGDVGQYDPPILRNPQTDPEVPVDIALRSSADVRG